MERDTVIDSEVIATLQQLDRPGERSFLAEMIEIFFEDTPPRLAELRRAIAARDVDAVIDTAHVMKGSCSNFGAHRLEDVCREMEVVGRAGDLDPAAALLRAIETEYERVHAALSEYL